MLLASRAAIPGGPEPHNEVNDMKGTLQREKPAEVQRQQVNYMAPVVNIFETKDGYALEAEMPGVNKDGLEVTLEGTELTITGHRNSASIGGDAVFCECSKADFRRVFELDPAIDTGKIAAKMDQGILMLTLPKSERVKPRRISVD